MRTPVFARASALPYAAGNLTINPNFLKALPVAMVAPEIRVLWIRITGVIAFGGAATVPGKNLILELISRLLVVDPRGNCVSCTGTSLRQWAQHMLGNAYVDPADVVAGGAGNQNFDFSLPIPFEFRQGQQPSDFRKPTSDLTEGGGQIILTLGSGTLTPSASTASVTAASTTVEMYGEIYDAGQKQAGTRLALQDYVVPAQDFRYEVEGFLLGAWYSAQMSDVRSATTVAARSWIWDGLGYLNFPNTILDPLYRSQKFSHDNTNDDISRGVAQNLFWPANYSSSAELPDLQQLQARSSVAIETGAQVVIAALTPRAPAAVAMALGVPQGALPAVEVAAVSSGATSDVPYAAMPDKLRAILPVKAGMAKHGLASVAHAIARKR